MRNLIKKDLMCSGIDYRFLIVIISILMMIGLVPFLEDYFIIAAYFMLIGAPLVHFLNIFNHTEKDYYITEIFYPLKINKIILSRYISYLTVTLLAMFFIGFIVWVRLKIYSVDIQMFQVNILGLGFVFAILYGTLILSGSFIFGNNHIKVIGVTAFALTLIPIRIFMEVIRYIFHLNDVFDIYNYSLLIQMLSLFSLILYVASAFISIYGFKRRVRR